MAGVAGSQPADIAPQVQPPPELNIPKGSKMPSFGAEMPQAPEQPPQQQQAQSANPLDEFMLTKPESNPLDEFVEKPSVWEQYGKPLMHSTLEALPTAGAAVGGVLGGTVAGVPTLGMGAVGGALVGATAGGALGKSVQNAVESFMGEPKSYADLAMGPVQGAVEGAGQEAGGMILAAGVGKVAKMLAVKPVKTAVETVAALPEQAMTAEMADALATNEAAKKAGVHLLPNEIFPNDPKLQLLHERALGTKQFQDAQMERAGQIRKLVENISGNFQTEGKTAQEAVQNASSADRFYGKQIGNFTDEVVRNSKAPTFELNLPAAEYKQQTFLSSLGNDADRATSLGHDMAKQAPNMAFDKAKLDAMTKGEISSLGQQAAWEPGKTKTMTMTNLQDTLKDMRQKFGFIEDSNGAYTIPSVKDRDAVANRLNMPRAQVDGFVADVNKFSQQIVNSKGQMKPEQVIKMQKVFGAMADQYAPAYGEKSSSTFANAVQLKNGFRDDFMAGADQFLSPESKKAFVTAKDRFHQLMTLPKGVDKLLAKDSPATADIANWLDKGAEANASNIAGLQKAVRMESPDAWEPVAQAYTKRLFGKFEMPDATGQRIGGYDWQGMNKLFESKGPAFDRLSQVIGPERAQSIADLAKASAAIQEADKPFKLAAGKLAWAKAAVKIWKGNPEEAVQLIGQDRAAQKLLSDPNLGKQLNTDAKESLRNLYNNALEHLATKSPQPRVQIPALPSSQE